MTTPPIPPAAMDMRSARGWLLPHPNGNAQRTDIARIASTLNTIDGSVSSLETEVDGLVEHATQTTASLRKLTALTLALGN